MNNFIKAKNNEGNVCFINVSKIHTITFQGLFIIINTGTDYNTLIPLEGSSKILKLLDLTLEGAIELGVVYGEELLGKTREYCKKKYKQENI